LPTGGDTASVFTIDAEDVADFNEENEIAFEG
jgi:hypothetical protein